MIATPTPGGQEGSEEARQGCPWMSCSSPCEEGEGAGELSSCLNRKKEGSGPVVVGEFRKFVYTYSIDVLVVGLSYILK